MTDTITTTAPVLEASLANGGGTFAGAEPVTSGYAVGIQTIATCEELTQEAIDAAWLELSGSDSCLGTWFDQENGVWEIQETAVLSNRRAAIALADAFDERYIYDLDAQECIEVAGERFVAP